MRSEFIRTAHELVHPHGPPRSAQLATRASGVDARPAPLPRGSLRRRHQSSATPLARATFRDHRQRVLRTVT